MITFVKSKRIKKKNNNLKTQNLIISAQSRVPNNAKIHQPKVEMQEKKNPPKLENKNERNNLLCVKNERERERERENILCEKKL